VPVAAAGWCPRRGVAVPGVGPGAGRRAAPPPNRGPPVSGLPGHRAGGLPRRRATGPALAIEREREKEDGRRGGHTTREEECVLCELEAG
jgi:hypothetical protein